MADPGTESCANKPEPSNNDGSPEVFESFERLVEEHCRPAYRFAFSLSGNHSDACDIAQQAFYLAQTKSHQLRDPAKRKQWLFTILHREFLRMRRRDTAHLRTTLEYSEHELTQITVDHVTSLDSKTLLRLLETLDENFKIPLVLFYLRQFSYKEIAATLEVPIGTVMSRLARGKQMLRMRLEQKPEEERQRVVRRRREALHQDPEFFG